MNGPETSPAEERAKRAGVRNMKWLALSLLIAMLVMLALSSAWQPAYPALSWVAAFAEAAAVGAIADWFAVTALFRHPLRLPFPHTAIIRKKKDDIGESLGRFIEHNFLTPENVLSRVHNVDLALACADWLVDPLNSHKVARRVGSFIPGLLEKLDDEDVQRFFERAAIPQLERLDLARAAGFALDFLAAEGVHQAMLDPALRALDTWLNENRGLIKAKFGQASRYTPGFLDAYIVNRFLDGISMLVHEVARDPDHELRARFDQAARELIEALKTSEVYRERGHEMARRLIDHLRREEYYRRLWQHLEQRIVADVADRDSVLVAHLGSAFVAFGSALRQDAALQRKLNQWAFRTLRSLTLRHRHQVSRLIADVVRSWDAREVSEKLELEIGRDLQYIRLSGTFVGGIVGVLLHGAVRLAT